MGTEVQMTFNSSGTWDITMVDAEGDLPEGVTADMQEQAIAQANQIYAGSSTKWRRIGSL